MYDMLVRVFDLLLSIWLQNLLKHFFVPVAALFSFPLLILFNCVRLFVFLRVDLQIDLIVHPSDTWIQIKIQVGKWSNDHYANLLLWFKYWICFAKKIINHF